MALSENDIAAIEAAGGITSGGRTYGQTTGIQEFITEDQLRAINERWLAMGGVDDIDAAIDDIVDRSLKNDDGLVATSAKVYGMEQACSISSPSSKATSVPSMIHLSTPLLQPTAWTITTILIRIRIGPRSATR